ncbi:ERMIN protein, partial [Pteruthius melanotis]|nr:ERMIN protein [Pteruthius melanotis]
MTEEIPAAPTMPACNGSAAPRDGPLQILGAIDEIAKSVGTVPYANAEMSPDTSPEKENLEENRNSWAEDITPGNFAGEKRCQGTVRGCLSLDVGREKLGFVYSLMNNGMCCRCPEPLRCRAGPGGTAGPGTGLAESPAGSAEPRGNAAAEEEAEAEEEDTEEDEVQVIEIKKENSQAPRSQQRDSGKRPPPPAGPAGNSPREKPGEHPSLGKKNDISRHSYSRYNTISYRRIRKGNTKQRIDEFESMMHL